ncbi:uncharacterized protein METZ01_LOCUS356269, partial [marine metagenome]
MNGFVIHRCRLKLETLLSDPWAPLVIGRSTLQKPVQGGGGFFGSSQLQIGTGQVDL